MNSNFSTGSLVHVRNRDWVVEPDSTPDLLHLRPLAGAESESAYIIPDLEPEPLRASVFDMPNPESLGNLEEIRLLQDAVRMKLRAGAGPFRSFGNIAVEPRAYQLVPLLMALRLPTIRLLIADDVGVGKTIEAGLIVRELMDRGEISRFTVLCPPHLVDQWQKELAEHFNIQAVAITPGTIRKLESKLPNGESIFSHCQCTIVSLDYIKSDRHCPKFENHAPECIVVDEAHACTLLGTGHQKRFALLKRLANDTDRHIIMLTATPHSGNEVGFYNLLSLLKPHFASLKDANQHQRENMREQLARHFVQRQRADIQKWEANVRIFPKRIPGEIKYNLSDEWGRLFDDIQAYCKTVAEERAAAGNRLAWYSTISLLRCVSSSPAAAVSALHSRLNNAMPDISLDDAADDLLDNDYIVSTSDAEELLQGGEDADILHEFINRAQGLKGVEHDPKLRCLVDNALRDELLRNDCHPIIFCRYIHTADYVAEELKKAFPDYTVTAITGSLAHDMREKEVEELGKAPKRILVATDCLSEGINLQDYFDAVVHYDLAWNPTRHEQREGRVDRYGQKEKKVYCLMFYGKDNPIDGFILNVILKKADIISKELGVKVPVPDDKVAITNALMQAALLKREEMPALEKDMMLDFGDVIWKDVKEKANRTIFNHNSLRPEDVLPEWERQSSLIGSQHDVQRFVQSSCSFLRTPLTSTARGASFGLNTNTLPDVLREELADFLPAGRSRISFEMGGNGTFVSRSHPLVVSLADYVMEQSLENDGQLIHRAAVTPVQSEHVSVRTVLYFTRMRHRLTYSYANKTKTIMAEEAVVLVSRHGQPLDILPHQEMEWVRALVPMGDIHPSRAKQMTEAAIQVFQTSANRVDALANARAAQLLEDHTRVRAAARAAGNVTVDACYPVDLLAVSVLVPQI